jgi:hypothetical protein
MFRIATLPFRRSGLDDAYAKLEPPLHLPLRTEGVDQNHVSAQILAKCLHVSPLPMLNLYEMFAKHKKI